MHLPFARGVGINEKFLWSWSQLLLSLFLALSGGPMVLRTYRPNQTLFQRAVRTGITLSQSLLRVCVGVA